MEIIMIKLDTNNVRLTSTYGLKYTPSGVSYRVMEVPCAWIKHIEPLTEEPTQLAEMYSACERGADDIGEPNNV